VAVSPGADGLQVTVPLTMWTLLGISDGSAR
jgi:hypothetical protein